MATKPTNADLTKRVAELEQETADLEARLEQAAETARDQIETGDKPTNVIEAILAVMRDVRAVGKDGFNEQHRFNFRGIDGTVNALGPAFREHGLVVLPQVRSVKSEQVETGRQRTMMNWTRVEVEYRFFGPGGVADTISVTTPGESFDSGDKGTAKAMSVAFRTALLQAFALPTQERDPDADSHELAPKVEGAQIMAEVAAALEKAQVEGRQPIPALKAVWDQYGQSTLEGVTVEFQGQTMTAAAYINGWVAQLSRPAQQPAQQPAPAQEPAQEAAPAQPSAQVPAQPEQPARAPQPEPARAPEQSAGAQAAAQQTARDVKEAPVFRPLRSEIAGQAETLGVPVEQYIAPLLATNQGAAKVSDLLPPVVLRWVADRRPAVQDALRAQARVTEADAYSRVPDNTPGMWEQLLGMTEQARESAPAPQDA